MSDLLLHLWSDKRSHLLQELDFYLAQADRRVLVQFGNLEAEAEQFANDEFEKMGRFASPDSDPGDYADAAWSRGANHYEMLTDLHSQMLLSVAAGLYHHWEKRFREWLVKEFERSLPREKEKLSPAIWKQKVDEVFKLMGCLGWVIEDQPFFVVLDECQLVVNVYKHGGGPSFELLKKRHGHHLGKTTRIIDHRDHTDLHITRDDLGRFQHALKGFWATVPEHIFWEDAQTVPKWFEKALEKNR